MKPVPLVAAVLIVAASDPLQAAADRVRTLGRALTLVVRAGREIARQGTFAFAALVIAIVVVVVAYERSHARGTRALRAG